MATLRIPPVAAASRFRRLRATARSAYRLAWLTSCMAAIAAAGALSVATSVFDLRPLAVQSGSMEPALPLHSLILVEEAPPSDVAVGDVITFDPPGSTPRVTHRVVGRQREGSRWYFTTQGDANPAPDDWRRAPAASETHLRGITYGDSPAIRHVATIPHAGLLTTMGASSQVRTVAFAGLLLWAALGLLKAIWRPSVRRVTTDPQTVAPCGRGS